MDDRIDAQLIECVNKPIAFFDADGVLIRANRAWEMFCCEPSEAMLILTYDDLVEQFKLPLFEEMQIQDKYETRFNRRAVIVIRRRLLLKNTHGIMIEVDDVTSIEEKTALIDSTINDAMWQIRSRVASVRNVLTLLVDYSDGAFSGGETGELLRATRREMWELSRHIEDLRDLTAINSGGFSQQIRGETLQLRELLENIRIDCNPIIPVDGKMAVLVFDLQPDLSLFCDRHICLKALSAVIFNALTYSDNTGTVRVTARQEEGNSLHISVHDCGWGIPDHEQNRVFSYGFRGERVRRTDIAGLGVGLFLARTLLGMINSEISFISKEGAGTRFDIILREITA